MSGTQGCSYGTGDQKSERPNHSPGARGRLDVAGDGEVELKLTSHTVPRGKPLLLDMSEVTFLSSLGLRMLFTVAKALDRRGAKMVLLSPQPTVREVLLVSGFDQLMPIHQDEAQHWHFLPGAKVDKFPGLFFCGTFALRVPQILSVIHPT